MKSSFLALAALAALAISATVAVAAPQGIVRIPETSGPRLYGYGQFGVWSPSGKIDVGEIMFPRLELYVDTTRVAYSDLPYDQRVTSDNRPDWRYDLLKFYGPAGNYQFSFATNLPGCPAGDDKYVLPEALEMSLDDQEENPLAEKIIGAIEGSIGAQGASLSGLGVFTVRFPHCMEITITRGDITESVNLTFENHPIAD